MSSRKGPSYNAQQKEQLRTLAQERPSGEPKKPLLNRWLNPNDFHEDVNGGLFGRIFGTHPEKGPSPIWRLALGAIAGALLYVGIDQNNQLSTPSGTPRVEAPTPSKSNYAAPVRRAEGQLTDTPQEHRFDYLLKQTTLLA